MRIGPVAPGSISPELKFDLDEMKRLLDEVRPVLGAPKSSVTNLLNFIYQKIALTPGAELVGFEDYRTGMTYSKEDLERMEQEASTPNVQEEKVSV